MVLNLIFPDYHKLGYTDPVSDKPIVGVALNKLCVPSILLWSKCQSLSFLPR